MNRANFFNWNNVFKYNNKNNILFIMYLIYIVEVCLSSDAYNLYKYNYNYKIINTIKIYLKVYDVPKFLIY